MNNEDEWWMGYDLQPGEEIVLINDVTHYPSDLSRTKVYRKGARGRLTDEEDAAHQSINGTLASVMLEGEVERVVL